MRTWPFTQARSILVIRGLAERHARSIYRAASLLSYGAVALILPYVGSIALAAYNDACEIGDRFVDGRYFGAHESVIGLQTGLVIAIPILLARSKPIIQANAIVALLTLVLALGLVFTARTPPYECVTMGGDYEDHASGLPEFWLLAIFLFFISCVLVVIDLFRWAFLRLVKAFRH
jgi:hypothetical protein